MSRGSNLRAMAQGFIRDGLPVGIAFCVVTRRDAPVTDVCREFGIPCFHISYNRSSMGADAIPPSQIGRFGKATLRQTAGADALPPYSETFESALLDLIRSHQIDLISLAGFLKLLSTSFISACAIPILNIHPALLPRYGGKGMYGAAVHQAVFESGDKVSGATVHRVNEHYDQGQIILQSEIEISDCQSPAEVASRVQTVEHRMYAQAIWQVLRDAELRFGKD